MKRGFTLIELIVVVVFMLSTTFLFLSFNNDFFKKKILNNTILILNSNIRKANLLSKDKHNVIVKLDFIEKSIDVNNDKIFLNKDFEYITKSTNEKNRKKYMLSFKNGILNKSFSIIIFDKKGKVLKEISYLNTSYTRGLIIHVK